MVCAVVEFVPSLATSEIVAPASPVPLAVALLALARSMGFVADVMATVGATVSLVTVWVRRGGVAGRRRWRSPCR